MAWGCGGSASKPDEIAPFFFNCRLFVKYVRRAKNTLLRPRHKKNSLHYITNTMEDETAKTVRITLFELWEKKDIQGTEVSLESKRKILPERCVWDASVFRNFIIKEGECYFTKRNVASHSMHHNESAECMSGEKKIHSLSSENYLLRRILSFWASIKGCNSKFDKKGGNILHRGPQLLFLSYLLLLSSENLLYRHFPLSSL